MDEETKPWGVWPVASYVRDAITANGWTDEEFSSRLSYLSPRLAKRRLDAVMGIEDLETVPGTFHALGRAFGTSAELWQRLNKAFFDALRSGEYYLCRDRDQE